MKDDKFQYLVIGAGPAGIAIVGKLIDAGVDPAKLAWVDPFFNVGDLGKKWLHVSSNTNVDLFLKFLQDCKSFNYDRFSKKFPLNFIPEKNTCLLNEVAKPLQAITDDLIEKVVVFKTIATALNLINGFWEVKTEKSLLISKNVILAIGCDPKKLDYSNLQEIPLDVALNPEKLPFHVCQNDTVAVFGSSHSAILILSNLLHLNIRVVNFYRSPHLYAVEMGDWLLFDNTGLKGYAAEWARKNLDGQLPKNLRRVLSTEQASEEFIAECTKVVYPVGFKRRRLPVLEQYSEMTYNDKTGIIAPGLFGLGIAFPEAAFDRFMNLEHRVGLWKFMEYINKVLPIWLKYSN